MWLRTMTIMWLLPICYVLISCSTSQSIQEKESDIGEYIDDLRDIVRIGGRRTIDEKLLILNIKKKQAVFGISDENAHCLSRIKSSAIEEMSIIKNQSGNFDSKYSTIIILTLTPKVYDLLGCGLSEKLI